MQSHRPICLSLSFSFAPFFRLFILSSLIYYFIHPRFFFFFFLSYIASLFLSLNAIITFGASTMRSLRLRPKSELHPPPPAIDAGVYQRGKSQQLYIYIYCFCAGWGDEGLFKLGAHRPNGLYIYCLLINSFLFSVCLSLFFSSFIVAKFASNNLLGISLCVCEKRRSVFMCWARL